MSIKFSNNSDIFFLNVHREGVTLIVKRTTREDIKQI